MTPYEWTRVVARPFLLLPLHHQVRREARSFTRRYPSSPALLDVGGRRSPYSIGLPAEVTITDLPRRTTLQHDLDLGLEARAAAAVVDRRSNVRRVIFDDMTDTHVAAQSVDIVLAVEVLEHVEADDKFVANVARVMRPTGTFLMTTPNGDSVVNTNPDHKRHYTRDQLRDLLSSQFDDVQVRYAVKNSVWRARGLRSWSPRHPVRTAITMLSNVVNSAESARPSLRTDSRATRHLIAICRSPRGVASSASDEVSRTPVSNL